MAGIAVESRRYGKAKKPLILAHNANSAAVYAEAQETAHKFHLLCGVNDDIVRPDQIEEFVSAVPGTTVETITGAGHLLFFTHWREILSAITLKLR